MLKKKLIELLKQNPSKSLELIENFPNQIRPPISKPLSNRTTKFNLTQNLHTFQNIKLSKSKSLYFSYNKVSTSKEHHKSSHTPLKTQRNFSISIKEPLKYPKIIRPQLQVNPNSKTNIKSSSNNQFIISTLTKKLKNKSRNQFRSNLNYTANMFASSRHNINKHNKHFLTFNNNKNNGHNSQNGIIANIKPHDNENGKNNLTQYVKINQKNECEENNNIFPTFKILSYKNYKKNFTNKHHSCINTNNLNLNKSNNSLNHELLLPLNINNVHKNINTNTENKNDITIKPNEEEKNQTNKSVCFCSLFSINSITRINPSSQGFSTPMLIPQTSPQKQSLFNKDLFKNVPNFKPAIYSSSNDIIQTKINSKKVNYIKAFAYNTHQGIVRNYNEDMIQITKILNNSTYFFGLYDGHGGHQCSTFLKNTLHSFITYFSIKNVKTAISLADSTFIDSVALNHQKQEIVNFSGSCACNVLINGSQCIISNVGDSKCLLIRNNKIHYQTIEHKPNEFNEKQRIINNGGNVYQSPLPFPIYQNGKEIIPPFRVFPGNLSVSRTIGDIKAKIEKYGGKKGVVISTPDVELINLDNECNYMIIACDGIFDVMENEDVMNCVQIAKEGKTEKDDINIICADAANLIIKTAIEKESFDNVSCIVIAFNLWK